jgi:hypothetical protein
MTLVWEGESQVHCIVEHHHGRLYLFTDASREGVRVNSHYLMQSDVESPGPKSWKVRVTIYYVISKLSACTCSLDMHTFSS